MGCPLPIKEMNATHPSTAIASLYIHLLPLLLSPSICYCRYSFLISLLSSSICYFCYSFLVSLFSSSICYYLYSLLASSTIATLFYYRYSLLISLLSSTIATLFYYRYSLLLLLLSSNIFLGVYKTQTGRAFERLGNYFFPYCAPPDAYAARLKNAKHQ
ncbi:hypothetical protein GGI42DRAFT_26545 [Trichoderma sp. SZMC 28013]